MIYLDNAATTKPLKEVLDFAARFYGDSFYNPSALYKKAIEVKNAVGEARNAILKRFPFGYEATFVSCGSEADNAAVFSRGTKGNFVTTAGEHSAVYESFLELKRRGAEVRFAPLNEDGGVKEEELLALVDENTSLVSVVHVNNETGAINDINRIAAAVKRKNPQTIFHSDGVQAFGKLPYRISGDVDLYSASAHKIGGPKGTGVLVRKKGVNIRPTIFGGGQESGLRSGTENVFGITAFAEAADIRFEKIRENYDKIDKIKKEFISNLNADDLRIISSENSSPYILSLSAVGLRGEVVQHLLEDDGIIIGTGSACSSRHRHSRILGECGYKNDVLDGALRISFTCETDPNEAAYAAKKLNERVAELKKVMRKK